MTSVSKSGALAPEWLFWISLWRQKIFGAPRKKHDFYFFGRYFMKILEFEWFCIAMGKLSYKNAIKIVWCVIFNFKKLQIVAPLTKIVALFEKKLWGAFWRFSTRKRAPPDSEVLTTLINKVEITKIPRENFNFLSYRNFTEKCFN